MKAIRSIPAALILLWLAVPATAQANPKGGLATIGRTLYVDHCATCHGMEGHGDGPTAAALKTPPPDLTTIAQSNNGKFPAKDVRAIIIGDKAESAHGSREMPLWGPVFLAMSGVDQKQANRRVDNLVNYLKSIQK